MTPPLQARAGAAASDDRRGRRALDAHDRAALYSDFTLHFLLPISLIVVLAMIALLGGALWLTTLQDRGEAINERARVRASFIAQVEGIATTTRVFAVWDDATRRLVATFDPVWTDINIGAYVFDQNQIKATFVIDGRGVRSTDMSIPSGRWPIPRSSSAAAMPWRRAT